MAGHLQGVRRITVDRAVVRSTLLTLQEFGSHSLEGLVLWLGTIEPERAHVVRAFIPEQHAVSSEDGLGYFVNGDALFLLNQGLAKSGLRLIAQVHSHPRAAFHSGTDDRYAIVTAEGGLSLVVPNFGHAPANPTAWAVYRLDRGEWVELTGDEARTLIEVKDD